METEKISFKGPEDKAEYVVRAITWLEKNRIRIRHTKLGNIAQGKIDFNDEAYTCDILKLTVTKNGQPLTDEDLKVLGPKTGDLIEQAVNLLNFLAPEEVKNLEWQHL